LSRLPLFEKGAFEFQDEAAQIASILCGAKPGMRVLDLAAGAGGKSLALAAAMKNKGEIVAFDIDAARLARLDERKSRAGASIIRSLATDMTRLGTGFDIVLVDAPCSGTGTWRRQPESRWRLTPAALTSYRQTQAELLDNAAPRVKKGGMLVYATCSILPSENGEQVRQFLSRHGDFAIRRAADVWHAETGLPAPSGMAEFFAASPYRNDMDGFFAALLVRG
jgi:16S rRNA (cytosine967-C5)-methyltransferase